MALEFLGTSSQPFLGLLSTVFRPLRPSPDKVVLPQGRPKAQQPTSTAEIQEALQSLHARKQEWADLDNKKKSELLRSCSVAAYKATEEGARLLTEAKGSYGNRLGEERISLLSPIQAFREGAEALEAEGQPKPKHVVKRANGQYVAQVFPTGYDAIFFGGFKGEVWIQPGNEPSQGSACRRKSKGSVALVLGAGNQIAVALCDILHMLVVECAVVICKMNPVIDYLRPYVEKALAPLIEAGYVRIVYGGAEQGAYLTNHTDVDRIHLTGSAQTFDAIVWQGKPKVGQPPLQKPITAELGCVSPCIVAPGKWSKKAIEYHADECVAGLINNAGHNCTKLEVLITAKDWPQRNEFIQAIRQRLQSTACKVAWYPGSAEKYAAFKAKFPQATELGSKVEGATNDEGYFGWTFAEDLSPAQADVRTENWCGVLQEVALPGKGTDASAFLAEAVDFANHRCWGSLSCSVLAPPDLPKEALDKAIEDLHYGGIAVNLPSFCNFIITKLSWGAYPGNTYQKSVLYAPWLHYPRHLWSPQVRNLESSSYHAARFQAYQGFIALNVTALNALRG